MIQSVIVDHEFGHICWHSEAERKQCQWQNVPVNKSQGQTPGRVGIFLPKSLFRHGQLYFASSRVPRACDIKVVNILSQRKLVKHSEKGFTLNVVNREILE